MSLMKSGVMTMTNFEMSDRCLYWALPPWKFELYQRRTDAWNNTHDNLSDEDFKIYQTDYFIPDSSNYWGHKQWVK